MKGPLQGLVVIELGGIGPAPYGCMLLSDLGAEVIRVERSAGSRLPMHRDVAKNLLLRGRRSIQLDLKNAAARDALFRGLERADVLIDPFRPGVTERLGVGPEECRARNERLIYARMTGWGQTGPLARTAGHDLNYLALTGPLAASGNRDDPPTPPLPNVGDFGGGGAMLAFGIVTALFERNSSGQGQVIDIAIVDGLASMFSNVVGYSNMGHWTEQRENNVLDGGAHYYACYETSDRRFVSVAAVEPASYATLLELLGLDPAEWPQDDRREWPSLKRRLADLFRTETLPSWCDLFAGSDACFAPVLPLSEARTHEHLVAREVFVEVEGMSQAAPVPRFGRTPGSIARLPVKPGADTREVLVSWGYGETEVNQLLASGAAGDAEQD